MMNKSNALTRSRNLFDPRRKTSFKLSRSRLEIFFQCPRCFYLDRRLGVERPRMPGFTLNSAVDQLLKNEFDIYRNRREAHPLMKQYGINAIPFGHPDLDLWRENFKGIQYHDQEHRLIISGAIDDLWVSSSGQLFVVDYKSTSVKGSVSLEGEYKEGYKRQMEIYQWLFRKNGFDVLNTGYFVYCNADKEKKMFDGQLEFDMTILPYEGQDSWVDDLIVKAHDCLMAEEIPQPTDGCEYCRYISAIEQTQRLAAFSNPQKEFEF